MQLDLTLLDKTLALQVAIYHEEDTNWLLIKQS